MLWAILWGCGGEPATPAPAPEATPEAPAPAAPARGRKGRKAKAGRGKGSVDLPSQVTTGDCDTLVHLADDEKLYGDPFAHALVLANLPAGALLHLSGFRRDDGFVSVDKITRPGEPDGEQSGWVPTDHLSVSLRDGARVRANLAANAPEGDLVPDGDAKIRVHACLGGAVWATVAVGGERMRGFILSDHHCGLVDGCG